MSVTNTQGSSRSSGVLVQLKAPSKSREHSTLVATEDGIHLAPTRHREAVTLAQQPHERRPLNGRECHGRSTRSPEFFGGDRLLKGTRGSRIHIPLEQASLVG